MFSLEYTIFICLSFFQDYISVETYVVEERISLLGWSNFTTVSLLNQRIYCLFNITHRQGNKERV